jgi:SecD/SecF fusion protein
MKNRGFVKFITVTLILACIYQLSFTFKARSVEKKAEAKAKAHSEDSDAQRAFKKAYLDSMKNLPVYNLGIGKFTYQEVKEKELNLGLDLRGGMNVTLEISAPDIIRMMSGDTKDEAFNQAIDAAEKEFLGQQNFVDLLAQRYNEIAPNGRIASIFYSRELENELPNKFESTNDEVFDYIKKETDLAIDRAFEILTARIDKFGVAQPNIQRLDNGRILVELPGVDDPARIRNVLQSSAKLEFWNVYPNYEAYEFLKAANDIIASQTKDDDTTSIDETPALTPDEEPSLTPEAAPEQKITASNSEENGIETAEDESASLTPTEGSLADDTTSSDSLAEGEKTQEQIQKENPLLSLLIPNITQDGQNWGGGAHVGFIPTSKMEQIEEYLNRPDVKALMPSNLYWKWSFKSWEGKGEFYQLYALKSDREGSPALEGDVITDARPARQPNGEMKVSMTMNKEGARAWRLITAAASRQNPKESVAIILDNLVYSAPTVQGEIPNGMSEISGDFTQRDADDLSNILKAGKLPAPARITGESTVGPTLGQKSINSGLTSLIVGFLLVVVFMVLYYGKAGIYADIALVVNLILIIGVLSGLGAALTLPGMAGLVLTIGMAVDANVLIFERVREELKAGKSHKMAVKDGYSGAYSSIIDANITTLIAGIILWLLGKGPVMGFAVILVIGIISSLFTAIYLTRVFVEMDTDKDRETSFYSSISKNWVKDWNLNLLAKRKMFYMVSGAIILVGIVSLATRGVSTGVDFRGGWNYIVKVENSNATDIKNSLDATFQANNEVKTYGEKDQYRITTTHLINSTDRDATEQVERALVTALDKYNFKESDILSSNKVGPTIAKDIKVRSTWAIIIALIGMFLYIAVRFRRWAFGVGATVALFHDVLIVFSLFSLLNGILPFALDLDQAFIAAILTVVGYSINDTVVIFDRIRDYLGIRKDDEVIEPVNTAINKTLNRTFVTSATTILVVLVLFIFGGQGLKSFTFTLLIGVLIGTYSSLCVASPIVVDILTWLNKRKKK